MRLIHVIPHMLTGGAQRLLADMLPVMARRDDLEITLLTYSDAPSPLMQALRNMPRIRIRSLGIPLSDSATLNPLTRLNAIRRLRPYLKECDVCHVHLFPALYDAAIAARGLDLRLIFTDHNTTNRRRRPALRAVERFIHSRYDLLAAVSPASGRALADWLDTPALRQRIHVIDNGICVERFALPASDISDPCDAKLSADAADPDHEVPAHIEALTERFEAGIEGEMMRRRKGRNTPDNKTLFGRDGVPVLMVSRFAASKGQQLLIRALHLLKTSPEYSRMKLYPDLFLAFAGSGPEMEKCRNLAKELGVAGDTVFLGDRADIPALVNASAAGAQISFWEGVGLTAVEMLAGRLPLIASDIPGLADTVRDAALTVANDPHAIADAIASIIAPDSPEELNDTILRCEAGAAIASRRHIRHTVDKYLRLYGLPDDFRPIRTEF